MIDKIYRFFFIQADLYCNNLDSMKLFEENDFGDYSFDVINDVSKIQKLQLHTYERGEKYVQVVEERLKSGNFYCFCFIEKTSDKAAYVRWLSTVSFYHDRYKRMIKLKQDEAFTMDSYTPVEFRKKGLHKEMNKRMLNYCKNNLKLSKIYMVILRGYPYLHKTVRELGYKRIRSHFYLKTDIFRSFVNKLNKAIV